jgi:hypothetical protein
LSWILDRIPGGIITPASEIGNMSWGSIFLLQLLPKYRLGVDKGLKNS